ncbi:MAG: STT3 domain-containing protein [Thermoanaerobaculia bacterium]
MPVAEGLIPPPGPSAADTQAARSARTRKAAAVAAAVFLASLFARLANLGQALPGGMPRIAPFDELYHAFRMDESVARPGRVSGFDPGRGPRGAFCPWPPLYDTAAGSAARILGARETQGMLQRVFWFPPLAASLFAAAAAFLLARRLDPWSGLLGGLAAALAPPFLEASRVGAIDHHFLEPALLLVILWATIRLGRAEKPPALLASGALLGAAISLALFVQPALLLAAGAAMVAVLASERAAEKTAGALAFLLAAIAVLLYRAAQPAGYPEGSWYLGTAHAACLAGAAAACAGAAFLTRRGVGPGRAIGAGILFGALLIAAFPGAAAPILSGARFLRGDPWLDTIIEFQPLFYRGWPGVPESLAALGGGALLLLAAATAFLAGGGARRRLAVFALFYLAATVATRRFLVPATPLLALAGAVAICDLRRRGSRTASLACLVLVAPALLGAIPLLVRPPGAVPSRAIPILRAAQTLRAVSGGGRVLSSWSWGHAFHVAGGRPVVVDNFGASIGQTDFQNALGIVLSPREDAVAAYCRQTGVRFLVLENPLTNLTVQAQAIGLSPSLFVRTDPGRPPEITARMRFSFWWRAYFDRGAAVREPRRQADAFRHFRLLYSDPGAPVGTGRFRGPAVEIWELSAP